MCQRNGHNSALLRNYIILHSYTWDQIDSGWVLENSGYEIRWYIEPQVPVTICKYIMKRLPQIVCIGHKAIHSFLYQIMLTIDQSNNKPEKMTTA